MRIQLIRHATLALEYAKKRIVVDPMFSLAGELDPTPGTANQVRNPLTPLPVPVAQLCDGDAYLISHTHRDHFDDAAINVLPKRAPLFCQPEDADKLTSHGFHDVRPIADNAQWQGISLHRTEGRHGTGEIEQRMAPVSGFVLSAQAEPTVYIAGDTIWCDAVQHALAQYQPRVVVVNGGEARFLQGDPITMGIRDIEHVAAAAPQATIVVAHMEAWNHCGLTRCELRAWLIQQSLDQRELAPDDGELCAL